MKKRTHTDREWYKSRAGSPCASCKEKPRTSYSCYCVDCKYKKDLRTRKPDVRRLGITAEEHAKIIEHNACDICGSAPRGKRKLSVDHCHKTGKIRGALCWRCNYGLVWFSDKPERLDSAAHYLRDDGRTVAFRLSR